jgi:hypothetical protein
MYYTCSFVSDLFFSYIDFFCVNRNLSFFRKDVTEALYQCYICPVDGVYASCQVSSVI